jgi:probable F420-dependent oxidoreductase
MPEPTKVGFLLPQFGEMAQPETLRYFGALGEELGYESIWAADHIITPTNITSPYPYNKAHNYPIPPEAAVLEPFVALSFLAGATMTLKLGFSVLILAYRHPVQTAKMLATLDVLSEGRLLIGAGVGWLEEEFAALDVEFRERGRRGDEIIEIWKQAWTTGFIDYEGTHYRVHEVGCSPRPVQTPIPHLSIGGHSEAAYRRMFRHGADGFQVVLDTADDSYGVAGTLAADLDLLRRLAEEYDRDPETVEITGVFITSTAERFLSEVDTYQKLGMSRFVLDFIAGSGTVSGTEQGLRTIAEGIGLVGAALP